MTTYNWRNPVSGAWTTAADWSPTGGPQAAPGTTIHISADIAVFATGKTIPYTVTGAGISASLIVTGDHVTFADFQNGDSGYGGKLTVSGGAVVTVDSTSSLDYVAHDSDGGGYVTVTDATVLDRGTIGGGGVALTASLLTVTGTSARLLSVDGSDISAGSKLLLTDGATYADFNGTDDIDGTVAVSGVGTSAVLAGVDGNGYVRIGAGGSVSVEAISGKVSFVLGSGANLEVGWSGSSSSMIFFTGSDATLTLETHAYTLDTPISGFTLSDSFLLSDPLGFSGAPATSATYSKGMLDLFDGTMQVGQLRLLGNYTGDRFIVSAVSATQSLVTLAEPPQISGIQAGQTAAEERPMHPFANVTLADPNGTLTETAIVSLGPGDIGALSDGQGLYTVTGTLAQVQAALRALTYVPNNTPGFAAVLDLSLSDGLDTVVNDVTSVISSPAPAPRFLAATQPAAGIAALGSLGLAAVPTPSWRDPGSAGAAEPHGSWFRFDPAHDGAMPPLWPVQS